MPVAQLFDLTGKNVLITGAGRGLGRGYAQILAEAGATVLCAGRHLDTLQAVVAELTTHGGQAAAMVVDVTKQASIDQLLRQLAATYGHLDVLVNNAGYEHICDFTEVTPDIYDRIMTVNLKGAFFLAQAAARSMQQTGGGKIINIASLGSYIGLPQSSVYCASKGGIVQLTKTMAVELGGDNIQVNCIAPGYFITPMTQPFYDDPQHRAWIEGRIPLHRWGTRDDLAGALLLLASHASDYITGTTIKVDGGWLAG